MQTAYKIFIGLVELVAVGIITILTDRFLSTRAAFIVLCVCLLILGWHHRAEIQNVYSEFLGWGRANRAAAVLIFGLVGFALLGGSAYWLTRKSEPAKGLYDPITLHTMSNEQLKDAEKQLSSEMIDLENELNKKSRERGLAYMAKLSATTNTEEQTRLHQEYANEQMQEYQDEESEFRKNYLDRASAVRDELLFRLRKTPDQSEKDVLAAFPSLAQRLIGELPLSRALSGKLNGPHSISDAALYLDALARLMN